MRGYMFRNRWGALFFVCLTAAGAASLIGGEDDEGLLLNATNELSQTRSDLSGEMADLSEPDERPVMVVDNENQLASDEELIDQARGLDPVPDVDPSAGLGRVEEYGDVTILIEDD